MNLKTAFRWVIAAQVMAVLAQALLAALARSGSQEALRTHMAFGRATLIIAAIQALAAVPLRRNARIPGVWALPAASGDVLTALFALPPAVAVATGTAQGRGISSDSPTSASRSRWSSSPRPARSDWSFRMCRASAPALVRLTPASAVPSSILLHALSLRQLIRRGAG